MKANIDQLRALVRDLPEGSMRLFKAIIEAAPNWSDSPPTYEVFPCKGSTIKKDEGHLTDLKKRDLVTTQIDSDNKEIVWINFTDLGNDLKSYLDELAQPPTLVVDGLAAHIENTAKKIAGHKVTPSRSKQLDKPAPAAKPAAKAEKFDRAAMRYQAIQECMAAVKSDTWKKSSYKPMLKQMQTNYPKLFAKLKTPEKVLAYSVGIVDFCLAACRKMDKKP